ncbi:MAG: hypothetical protein H6630_08930 [Arcobacter sp.]|nr:hypothetical protein [Arcobacter sp.]
MDLSELRKTTFARFGENNKDLEKIGFLWQDIDKEAVKATDFKLIEEAYKKEQEKKKNNLIEL